MSNGDNKQSADTEGRSVRVAAIQLCSGDDVAANLRLAGALLGNASDAGCHLSILPENFAFMGGRDEDKLDHAEAVGIGPIQEFLAAASQEYGMTIVAGSLPILAQAKDRCFGASMVFAPDGRRIACYRKIHLFDVDLPDSDEQYRESGSMQHGSEVVTVDTPAGRLGLSICYDLRFPELYRRLVDAGAELFSIPAAFTDVTGRAHWHTLLRARAIENLAYVIAPAQHGSHPGGRNTYGHSVIVDPWGTVLAESAGGDSVITADIDTGLTAKLRSAFPVLQHRRVK